MGAAVFFGAGLRAVECLKGQEEARILGAPSAPLSTRGDASLPVAPAGVEILEEEKGVAPGIGLVSQGIDRDIARPEVESFVL